MFSATLLAILAAAGLTYGWQPDRSGTADNQSLEYIVQISPDSIEGVAKLGQITSTIDPSIRGRVSRIVVRVGDGPVPRIDPAADDNVAMAIPEMSSDRNSPIAGLAMSPTRPRSVLKPGFGDLGFLDENQIRQSGENLRNNVADSLGRAADQLSDQAAEAGRNQIDRAAGGVRDWMRETQTTASGIPGGSRFSASANDPRGAVAAPSAISRVSPPPITGGVNQRLASGEGPTTEPRTGLSSRDGNYRPLRSNFDFPSTGPMSNASASGNAATIPPPWRNAGQPADQQYGMDRGYANQGQGAASDLYRRRDAGGVSGNGMTDTSRSDLRANGLRSNETFGRFAGTTQPTGTTQPSRESALSTNRRSAMGLDPAGDVAPKIGVTAAGEKKLIGRDNRILSTDQLIPELRAIGGTQIYQGDLFDRDDRIISIARVEMALNERSESMDPSRLAMTQPTMPIGRSNSPMSLDAPIASPGSRSAYPDNPASPRFPSSLTSDGRERFDRDGGRAMTLGYDAASDRSRPSVRRTVEPGTDRYAYRDEMPEPRRSSYDERRDFEDDRRFENRRSEDRRSDIDRGERVAMTSINDNRTDDARSSEARDPRDRLGNVAPMPVTRNASIAPVISHSTTPLFNGLLLVSAILNCYLFIWLRNMRVRYRDIVASKRIVETAM